MDDLSQIMRLLLSLAFVLLLMGGFAFLLKRLGLNGAVATPKVKRLKLIESLTLDARRRLVIIQRDEKQHLVILGVNGETIVETDIPAKASDDINA